MNFFANLHRRRGAEPAARGSDHAASRCSSISRHADLRRRGRRLASRLARSRCSRSAATSGATTSTSPSRPRPRTAPSSAPTCRTRSSSIGSGSRRRPRGQVRQPERSGVLAAPRRSFKPAEGPLAPCLLQPRVPLAVAHQQLSRHRHRQPDGLERARAAAAAAAAAGRGRAVSAGRARRRQPSADRRRRPRRS